MQLSSKQHIPALDGLRGLAILGVLSCHFFKVSQFSDLPSKAVVGLTGIGWVGVDLFFVLSGFLITGILLDSKADSRYFRNFYARRAVRIFPLYYSYLLVIVGLIGLAYCLQIDFRQVGQAAHDVLWAFAYLTNINITWENSNVTSVLNHFWSLAIEEQFYLVWPLLVYFTTRRQLATTCGLLIFFACALRIVLCQFGYNLAAGMLMPCRADSLAMGALIALACRDELVFSKILKMPKWVLPLFFLPLLLCWNLGSQLRAPILPGTLALAFGGLLFFCLVSPQGGFINQVFCSKVLTRLGKYSYGLYVLNQPIAFFPGNIKVFDKVIRIIHYPLAGTFIYALLAFGFTFGLAWLSWHLLEKPFLNMKKRFV